MPNTGNVGEQRRRSLLTALADRHGYDATPPNEPTFAMPQSLIDA